MKKNYKEESGKVRGRLHIQWRTRFGSRRGFSGHITLPVRTITVWLRSSGREFVDTFYIESDRYIQIESIQETASNPILNNRANWVSIRVDWTELNKSPSDLKKPWALLGRVETDAIRTVTYISRLANLSRVPFLLVRSWPRARPSRCWFVFCLPSGALTFLRPFSLPFALVFLFFSLFCFPDFLRPEGFLLIDSEGPSEWSCGSFTWFCWCMMVQFSGK